MAYTIFRSNGTIFAVIPDGEINSNSTVTLVGQNTLDYGQLLDENFLYLLENSANASPPVTPVTGELWFDTSTSSLKVWNGLAFILPPAGTAVTVTGSAQPAITSVGTLTSLNLIGPLVGTSVIASTVGNTGTTLVGTLSTAAQPQITTIGTLGTLTVTGNITAGNVVANLIGTATQANTSLFANVANSVAGANVTGSVAQANTAAQATVANTALSVSGANVSGTVASATLAATASVAFSVSGANVSGTVASATTATTASLAVSATTATTANTVSNAAQANITSVGTLTNLTVSGNATIGNVRSDNYQFANGTPLNFAVGNISSANISYVAPFNGAATLTGNSKWSQFVSVLDFGADPTGAADSRGAFQAALNTAKHVYIPTGNYKINDRLQMLYTGQTMSGDGRDASVLRINSEFNLSSDAIIDCSNLQPGVILSDFGITFTQPDTSTRASLTAYPVAIKMTDSPRTTIQNFKMQGAINGVDMTGNSGGTFIDLLEMSAFGTGISINGSLDTVRINQFHFWPFNLTDAQQVIFYSDPTRGISVGRVDNLMINEYLNISNLGLYMFDTTAWVNVENSGFDTYNGIQQLAGSLQVSNSYISNLGVPNIYAVKHQGGWAQYNNVRFICGSTNTTPVQLMNTITGSLNLDQCYFEGPVAGIPYITMASNCAAGTALQVENCFFNIGSTNTNVFTGSAPISGTFNTHFLNNIVRTNSNVAFSTATFAFANNYRIYMSGNRAYDKGTGAGTFINVPQDNWNWISGNLAPGWTMNFPAATQGFYSNNPR